MHGKPKRRFSATVVVRRFAWVRRKVKGEGWKPVRRTSNELGLTFGKHYVEYNPAFWKLLAKCQKAVIKEGAALDMRTRKPNGNDTGHFAVEVADITLTWPE